MRAPSETARLFVTQAVAKVAAELERDGLVPAADHSPHDAAFAVLLDQLVRLVADRTGPVGVYVLSQAFAASVQQASR